MVRSALALRVKIAPERQKFIIFYRTSYPGHQGTVIMKIMDTVQLVSQDLPAHVQVPQVGPRIVAAGITAALFINRPGVFTIAGIFYNKSAL